MPDEFDTSAGSPPAHETNGAPDAREPERTGEPHVPSDELARLKDSIWAEARRHFEGKARKPETRPEPQPRPPSSKEDLEVEIRTLRAEQALDRALRGAPVNERQYERIRRLMLAEQPDDVGSWVRDTIEDLGIASTQPVPEPSAQPRPVGPPASNAGTPGTAPPWESGTHPLTWSADDVKRIIDLKGERDGRKFIRDKFLTSMAQTRVLLPQRR
jgi:hypothetical protein